MYVKDGKMITKAENLLDKQLMKIRRTVGEAFVNNELFHNWGTEIERRKDVLLYMALYVDYVYEAGELYTNDDMTGFIGLEDSKHYLSVCADNSEYFDDTCTAYSVFS